MIQFKSALEIRFLAISPSWPIPSRIAKYAWSLDKLPLADFSLLWRGLWVEMLLDRFGSQLRGARGALLGGGRNVWAVGRLGFRKPDLYEAADSIRARCFILPGPIINSANDGWG
jgi:hypothetical protein